MNFSEALELLKKDEILTRSGWNGKKLSVAILGNHEMSNGKYIAFFYDGHLTCPWTPSQSDLLANDWDLISP